MEDSGIMTNADPVSADANTVSDETQASEISLFKEEERSEFTLRPTKIEVVTPLDVTKKLATFTPRRVFANKKRFRLTFGTNKKKKNTENKTYEVECITNKRITNGKLFYRVKWKGYQKQNWISTENLMCDDLIREFEERTKDRFANKPSVQSSSPVKTRATRTRNTRSTTVSSKMTDKLLSAEPASPAFKCGSKRPPSTSSGTTSATKRAKNKFFEMLSHADDLVVLMSEEQPVVCYADWSIVAVRPGSFPDQGPMAHLQDAKTDAHAYVSTAVLMRQCPQKPDSECRVLRKANGQRWRLGEGAFGAVFLARDSNDRGRLVALKEIPRNAYDGHAYNFVRFVREVSAMRHSVISRCPFVTQLIGASQNDKTVSLKMEFMECGSVASFVESSSVFARNYAARRIDAGHAAAIQYALRSLAFALRATHQANYLHKDFPAENVLINASGQIKLSDFGFCEEYIPGKIRQLLSTAHVMPPESYLHGRYYLKSESWQLGMFGLYLAFGYYYFGEHPDELHDRLEQYEESRDGYLEIRAELIRRGLPSEGADIIARLVNALHDERPSIDEVLAHRWIRIDERDHASVRLVKVLLS